MDVISSGYVIIPYYYYTYVVILRLINYNSKHVSLSNCKMIMLCAPIFNLLKVLFFILSTQAHSNTAHQQPWLPSRPNPVGRDSALERERLRCLSTQ